MAKSDPMTPGEITAVVRKHGHWLMHRQSGARADFSLKNISGSYLPGVNLCMAKLAGTVAHHSELSRCNLSNADLFAIDLRFSNLVDADFSNADLRGARLRGADLGRANLAGADLRQGVLIDYLHDKFIPNDLQYCNFHSANLRDANLRNANLYKSSFEGADLRGIVLDGAKLEKVNLRRAVRGRLYRVQRHRRGLAWRNFLRRHTRRC